MMPFNAKRSAVALLALIALIVAACGGGTPTAPEAQQPAEPVRETVVVQVEVTAVPAEGQDTDTDTGDTTAEQPVAEPVGGSFTTPHPILSDVNVRQAIAFCTNRPELIESVYPYLSQEEREALVMDTNLPQGHWALAPQERITVYPFDPEQGAALLDEAGWTLAENASIRTNEAGDVLNLRFTTTNAQFRQTWGTVFAQQMAGCGIQIIPTYAPAAFWFGATTGLARRDFELGAYAWVGQVDPGGQTLYACNQIPLPENNWNGQNVMGWCNERASRAIIAANNTLDREERIEQYAIFQEEFTADMVSLPLFNRSEALAHNPNLEGFRADPTEYFTTNIGEWSLTDGGDTLVLGFSQEPASLFAAVEQAAVVVIVNRLLGSPSVTTYNYDYQANTLVELPTIESGRTTLEEVEVSEGDLVWSADAEPVELAEGVEVVNSEGETVAFDGTPITMNRLVVNFEHIEGLTWEDGEPVKQADFELAAEINCNPETGVVSLTVCNSQESVEVTSDTEYTITYLPGALWPEYFALTLGAYPSHQVLADGRTLADVPANEWSGLQEIADQPLSSGPYRLVEWNRGQNMVFEANPNYWGGAPAVQNVIIQFVADTNQAVAQLLTGEIDVLDQTTLGGGAEIETVLAAQEQGQVTAYTIASPTWEHIDMNLFLP